MTGSPQHLLDTIAFLAERIETKQAELSELEALTKKAERQVDRLEMRITRMESALGLLKELR